MPKNIVFCADGTWNGLGDSDGPELAPDATNVLRFFSVLDGIVTPDTVRLRDELEKVAITGVDDVAQVSKYLHGVGDANNAITRFLGGVFGQGFIERIVRGYTFVSRHYVPGDRIYLLGFSRGAYTARALGGMIVSMGLLPRSSATNADGSWDKETAYRRGIHVWAQYRQRAGKRSTILGFFDELNGLRTDLDSLVPAKIEAIGVWDTVGALGIPVEDADRKRVDLFAFADTSLSPSVSHGFHALAIDEQREDFVPTLWDDRDGVVQCWFSGAHADVGGGYPSMDYCGVSLDWMVAKMRGVGILFSSQYRPADTFPFAPYHTPYKEAPFAVRPHGPRSIPPNGFFHPSVQARLDGDARYLSDGLAALFGKARKLPADRLLN